MPEIVNGLWIGDSLGLIERLAISSFLHNGHEFHLYTYAPVAGVPAGTIVRDANDVLPAASIFRYETAVGRGSVSAFSNLFRYKLLLEKGGWWVDTDVVCLKPFAFAEPIVFAREDGRLEDQLAAGIIKLPAGHDIARRCYEIASAKDKRALKWGEIGPKLLTQVVREAGLQGFRKDVQVFCPIPCWQWELIASADSGWSRFVSEQTYAIHLWHEMWRRAGKDHLTEFPATSLIGQLSRRYDIRHT